MKTESGSGARGQSRASIVHELVVAIAATLLAVLAMAVFITTARGQFMLYDGDSLVLEIARQSFLSGGPQDWSMSAVLFVFPELPIYLGLRSLLPTTQLAMVVNGILNLTVLYLLLRSIAGSITRDSRRPTFAAFVAFSVVVICLLTEHTADRESFELVSMIVMPTYYYGSALAGMACVALVLSLLRSTTSERPSAMRARIIGLAVIAALATASNPIFVIWAGAAVLGVLVLLVLVRRLHARAAAVASIPLGIGIAAGMLARIPLARFSSPAALSYFNPNRASEALLYGPRQAFQLFHSGIRGTVEGCILVMLIAAAVVAFVLCWRRRHRPDRLFLAAVGIAAPLGVLIVTVVSGATSARYLQPWYLAPLLSVLVLVDLIGEARLLVLPQFGRLTRGIWRGGLAGASLFALVASIAVLAPVSSGRYARPDCLLHWIGDRRLVGAGQYWDTRDLIAYGGSSVRLAQISSDLTIFPWLVNIAPFYRAKVSYLVSSDPNWLHEIALRIGAPSNVVVCDDYVVADYAGTPGAQALTASVNDSARNVGRAQGFLPPARP